LVPVTIRTAQEVGEVIWRLRDDAPVEPRYAFYM
jgi:hypothetical protein